ncbi:MAG: type II toxin-antitoxin system VapC family toxin [Sphingomonas sp.]
MIFVDSNVILDFLSPDRNEREWSRRMLASVRAVEPLAINAILRAETAPRFASLEQQSEYLGTLGVETVPIDDTAAFRAGQAFKQYRKSGTVRETIVADFLIGAHASTLGARLLTSRSKALRHIFPRAPSDHTRDRTWLTQPHPTASTEIPATGRS